ncbi:flagellum-specific ATP synthase [Spirochaetota bacterium]|nr:flagellum-specific ATP synthase [Spirochaetota bacterium]
MKNMFTNCLERVRHHDFIIETTKIVAIRGSLIEAIRPQTRLSEKTIDGYPKHTSAELTIQLGSQCTIVSEQNPPILGEVIAMKDDRLSIMAMEATTELPLHASIRFPKRGQSYTVGVGPALMGRVIDGLGRPIDGKGPIITTEARPLFRRAPHVLTRKAIDTPLATGVRSIDSMLTVGKGQRIGIFAGTGVGKSTLLSMISRHSDSDVAIAALIGERGREVKDFIENGLGQSGLKKAIVIVSSPDDPPLKRVRAAYTATTIGEYFRDRGQSVVLIVDSLTRLAYAQREIGLLRQEPPVSRGYPPSVFSVLNELLERAGNNEHGFLTAFYNVLVEGDDLDEPISDAIRGVLDGHIVLARKLAESGHFPAIDIPKSISRLMHHLNDATQITAAQKLRSWIARYQEMEDLINIGAYIKGNDPLLDLAVNHQNAWKNFLMQKANEGYDLKKSQNDLLTLCLAESKD